MAERTDHGFKTKDLLCECLTDGMIRVLNTKNGKWVTVRQSPKGQRQWVSCGHFEKDELSRYLRPNVKVTGAPPTDASKGDEA